MRGVQPIGNDMLFLYKAENDDRIWDLPAGDRTCEIGREEEVRRRARYLKSIKYGNRKPSRDMNTWDIVSRTVSGAGDSANEWIFEVVLDYGEHDLLKPTTDSVQTWTIRSDPYSTYTSGFEIRSYRLCRRILMFHHLHEKLKLQDYLVSSYVMEYDASGTGSFLKSVTQQGHCWSSEEGQYKTQRLPSLGLCYNPISRPEELRIRSTKPKLLSQYAASHSAAGATGMKTQWIDLNGEGTVGLLVQLNGAWYYDRNENPLVDLSPDDSEPADETFSLASSPEPKSEPKTPDGFRLIGPLSSYPVDNVGESSYFEDLDGNGHQNLVVVDENDRLAGYYERVEKDKWTNFREFQSILNLPSMAVDNSSSIRKFDITGNGLTDLVILDNSYGQVLWHESLGKRGYAAERRSRGSGQPIFWDDSNKRLTTTLADMSGDGMTDVVQLSNGRVSYWPNMGYGNFGTEIVMNNSPIFDINDGSFDPHRIYVVDIDGSGATDLVYLPPDGGAMLYRNHCGNGFSQGIFVPCFPRISDPTSVFVIDLLGKGTSCLCWVDTDSYGDVVIQYLDLNSPSPSTSGISKPNMLTSFENGVGLRTSISYWPSTKFYLKDERAGRPWKTRLPFPVHVVRRVVEEDVVTRSLRVAKYHYHDGYFDGNDREFRGFGMVEQWEHEIIALANGNRYRKPTCHKKLWFHTGAIAVSLIPDEAVTFGEPRIVSKLPAGLSTAGIYESFRALKGMQLRSEVFGQDGTARANIPYSVTENSYEVLQVQKPKDMQHPGIFKIQPRETLTFHYERVSTNPQMQHEIVLERNDFGEMLRSLDMRYGSKQSSLKDQIIRAAQERSEVTFTEVTYTNPIVGLNDFYKPAVAEISKSRILGLSTDRIVDFEMAAKEDFRKYTVKSASSMDSDTSLDTKEKIIVPQKCTKTIYRSKDMTRPLDHGIQEPFSVVHQVFELSLEKSRQLMIYDRDENPILPSERTCASIIGDDGHFVDLDGDGNWWAPSSLSFFGSSESEGAQLSAARNSFFSPTVTINPFGNTSLVEMDIWSLLPCKWTDAVGSVMKASNDYRVLEAVSTTDPNGNQTSVLVDALGRTVALAQMGKQGNETGESLDSLTAEVTTEELMAFFQKPTREVAAQFLGNAGKRWLLNGERQVTASQEMLPMFQVALFRTEHPNLRTPKKSGGDNGEIILTVSYLDGYSQGIQDVSLATWEDNANRWRFSGSVAFDTNGNTIQVLQQFFSPSHFFVPHLGLETPGKTTFFDAINRSVGELNPDHSWTKTCYDDAWSMREFSTKDTLLMIDPRKDPHIGKYFEALTTSSFLPSWYEQQMSSKNRLMVEAAKKSEKFANTPTVTHFDAWRRELVRTFTDGTASHSLAFRYDIGGNKSMEIDAMGRIAQRNWFDALGRRIKIQNIDSGTQVMFYDCLGEIMVRGDSSGVSKRYVRDGLRRNIETWITEAGTTKEILWSKTLYGDDKSYSASAAWKSNQKGRVVRIYDQSGIRTYDQYDFKGNCISATTRLAAEYRSTFHCTPDMKLEPGTWSTTAEFDSMNREYRSTDTTGRTTLRKFNLLSELEQVLTLDKSEPEKWSPHVAKIEYTADGLTSRMQFGNGSQTTYAYDERTRQLINKKTWRDSDGKVLEDITYTYDSLGRVSHTNDQAHQDVFFRNKKIDASRDYIYDGFGRLAQAKGREMVNANSGSPTESSSMSLMTAGAGGVSTAPMNGDQLTRYTELYEYDIVDNILKITHHTTDSKTANWVRTYKYADLKTSNRVASTKIQGSEERYEYDEVGCITSMSGYSKMGWDAFHQVKSSSQQRLKSAADGGDDNDSSRLPETTWFVYNNEGVRVRKVTDRSTIRRDEKPRRLKETLYLGSCDIYRKYMGMNSDKLSTDAQVEIHTSLVKEHPDAKTPFVLIEKDVLKAKDSGLLRWTLSPNLEVDDLSRIISYEEYTPFGSTTIRFCGRGIEAPSRYRFASYLRDHETGLYYCQARYYCPWLGRWLSPDPLDTVDGQNLYCYVGNDPVNWTDPTGTMRAIDIPVDRPDGGPDDAPDDGDVSQPEGASGGCCSTFRGTCQKFLEGAGPTFKANVHGSLKPRTVASTLAGSVVGFFAALKISSGSDASAFSNFLNFSVCFAVGTLTGLAAPAIWDGIQKVRGNLPESTGHSQEWKYRALNEKCQHQNKTIMKVEEDSTQLQMACREKDKTINVLQRENEHQADEITKHMDTITTLQGIIARQEEEKRDLRRTLGERDAQNAALSNALSNALFNERKSRQEGNQQSSAGCGWWSSIRSSVGSFFGRR